MFATVLVLYLSSIDIFKQLKYKARTMDLTAIIAFLISSQFATDCIQTQDNGRSGYARDSVVFSQEDYSNSGELSVKFWRQMYVAQDCSGTPFSTTASSGVVAIGNEVQGFFPNANGETVFEADWIMSAANGKKELGALGVNTKSKTVRLARNTPGFSRNTMLSLFGYKSAK